MYNMNISLFGYKVELEMLILIGVIYLILVGHTLCSCCNMNGLMEGFSGANTNYGESASFNLNAYKPINTNTWNQPDLTVTPGKPVPPAVQNIVNRPNGPLPLPEGELFLFANTPFKPECCPNTYSNSMGCACMNSNTYNYLITRGGNNVPYSEY